MAFRGASRRGGGCRTWTTRRRTTTRPRCSWRFSPRNVRTDWAPTIDVSAVEAGVELLGPLLLDVAVNGRTTRRPDFPPATASSTRPPPLTGCTRPRARTVGSRSPCSTTRSGKPSSGRWVARLGRRSPFATQAGRFAHQDDLDAQIAAWTSGRDRHEVMHVLQAAGVRAGAVQNAQDVNEHDPQIAHRDVFFELDHPVIGEARFEGVPFRLRTFAAGQLAVGAVAR